MAKHRLPVPPLRERVRARVSRRTRKARRVLFLVATAALVAFS